MSVGVVGFTITRVIQVVVPTTATTTNATTAAKGRGNSTEGRDAHPSTLLLHDEPSRTHATAGVGAGGDVVKSLLTVEAPEKPPNPLLLVSLLITLHATVKHPCRTLLIKLGRGHRDRQNSLVVIVHLDEHCP